MSLMRTLFCVLAKMWHAQCSLFISVVIFTVIWDHLVWYSTKVRFLDCSLSAVKPSLPQIISDWICDPLEFKSLEFVLGKWVSRLPRNYAGRDIFSYISSFFANHLHVKQDVGSARAMPAKAAGSPFFDSRVTFLAGPASLHINFLAQPTRSTIFTNRTIVIGCFSIGTNRTIGTNGPLELPCTQLDHMRK